MENQPPQPPEEQPTQAGQNRLFEPTPPPTPEEKQSAEFWAEIDRRGISRTRPDGTAKTVNELGGELLGHRRQELAASQDEASEQPPNVIPFKRPDDKA